MPDRLTPVVSDLAADLDLDPPRGIGAKRLTPAELDAMRASVEKVRGAAPMSGPWLDFVMSATETVPRLIAEVDALTADLREARDTVDTLATADEDLVIVTAERDSARADLARVTAERDRLLKWYESEAEEHESTNKKLDAARRDLARVTAERDEAHALLRSTAERWQQLSPAILALEPILRPALDAITSGGATNFAVVDFDHRGVPWTCTFQRAEPGATTPAEMVARAEKERDEARAAAEDGRQREACREIERDHARAGRDRLLAAAVKLTCGPDDAPSTAAERAAVALDEAIAERIDPLEDTGITYLQAVFWEAWANDIHELHEIVKAAGRCVCPATEDAAECAEEKR